jgi:multimeric flavodoxin WrbA
MRILGISGSPRQAETSGVSKLVKTVLEATGCDYEYVSLRAKKIGGCIACLQCVEDNICKVQDDLTPLRDQIVAAEAYVIGAPNYFTGINATTQALLERWFQFRHQAGNLLWGKLAVVVGVGGSSGQPPADDLEKYLAYNFIETIAKVTGQGAASCFSCGFGETCPVGLPQMMYGAEAKITPEMIPDVAKQPEVMQAAEAAGRLLVDRLRQGVDREAVTQKMMQAMMEKFKSSA